MKKLDVQDIKISNYNYTLPDDKIAKYPLEDRSSSKLLLYKDSDISTREFREINSLLPKDCLIVFNNTRVIHSRLFFRKPTGAVIEVFCLSPFLPEDYQISFEKRDKVVWNCMIGNSRRWKEDVLKMEIVVDDGVVVLSARKVSNLANNMQVEFSWENDAYTFSELLEKAGNLPIPPYLNRESEAQDDETYQTVYSAIEGSVAAPTAGLHFTPEVLASMNEENIKINYATLHVGAGTFKPVKSDTISGHQMHAEFISVDRSLIADLIENINNIVVVGTTSMRTVESLYYIGKQILRGGDKVNSRFFVSQWEPYEEEDEGGCSPLDALQAILDYMDENNVTKLYAETEIIIAPGYEFHYPKAIVTNFHQPQSTLLLLISAFIGDKWEEIYKYALENGFRFLSYGDSSLLFRGDVASV